MPGATEARRVSRFEADLLTILQGFLGRLPRSQVLPLLAQAAERPACLSRHCVELVQDALSKGTTLLLAGDAWSRQRFLRGGQIVTGRLWERTPPAELGLQFSPLSLDFLIWATAAAVDTSDAVWKAPARRDLSLGDRWLLVVAYETIRNLPYSTRWIARPPWRTDGLCQLLFCEDHAQVGVTDAPDFVPWLTPAGTAILEASQRRLADRWVEMELAKARATSIESLRATAAAQTRVLESFFSAIESAGRCDLARFLFPALRKLLRPGVTLQQWTGDLRLAGARLADRQAAYRDALAFLAQFQRLEAWQHEARGVGYFDENYQAAQLWKSDWETYNGDRLAEGAHALLDQTLWV